MELTEEPRTPTGLKTRHIFLDTEAYRTCGHNLYAQPMLTLKRYIDRGVFEVHTTDVTLSEVKSQLIKMERELISNANRQSRLLDRWNNRFKRDSRKFPVPALLKEPKNHSVAFEEFSYVLKHNWSAKEHEAAELKVGPLLKAYFSKKPPFDKEGSKEFPDAFALAALEAWCKRTSNRIYIISKDAAVQRAAEESRRFIGVTTLSELLNLYTQAQESGITNRLIEAFENKGLRKQIEQNLSANMSEVGAIYEGDRHEGEVLAVEFNQLTEVNDFDVLWIDDGVVECIIHAQIEVTAEVSFEDVSDAIWDKEDGIFFGSKVREVEVEDACTIRAFCELDYDDTGFSISSAHFLTNNLTISDFEDIYS